MEPNDKKISDLGINKSLFNTDIFPVSDGTTTSAVTAQTLATYVNNKLDKISFRDVVDRICIENIGGLALIDDEHIGPDAEYVVFDLDTNRLLAYADQRYYSRWNDSVRYGRTSSDNGVIPYEGKIYWAIGKPTSSNGNFVIRAYMWSDSEEQLLPINDHERVILHYRGNINSAETLADGSHKYTIRRALSQAHIPYADDITDAIVYDTATAKFYLRQKAETSSHYLLHPKWHGSDLYELSGKNSFRIFYNVPNGTYRRWDGKALVEPTTPSKSGGLTPFGLTVIRQKDDNLLPATRLVVTGVDELLAGGYVPYVFRYNKKSNNFNDKCATQEFTEYYRKQIPRKTKKGWNVYGSQHAIRITDGVVEFSKAGKSHWRDKTNEGEIVHTDFSSDPRTLIEVVYTDRANKSKHTIDITDYSYDDLPAGSLRVRNGKRSISLHGRRYDKPRLVRLKYALAFGLPNDDNKKTITPADMVTPLMEFAVCIMPNIETGGGNSNNNWSVVFART